MTVSKRPSEKHQPAVARKRSSNAVESGFGVPYTEWIMTIQRTGGQVLHSLVLPPVQVDLALNVTFGATN